MAFASEQSTTTDTRSEDATDQAPPLTPVAPSRSDAVASRLTDDIVGPIGRRTVPGRTSTEGFLTPMRVLILMTTVAAILAVLQKSPCRVLGWTAPILNHAGCYSDFSSLFVSRGFADSPFAPFLEGSNFEYPIGTAIAASLAALVARIVPGFSEYSSLVFFDVNFIFVVILWIITVIVVAKSAARRPWDAAMVAVAPGMILASSINWDMWAVAPLMLGMWLFAGQRYGWAGIAFGFAISAKIFPMLVFGAILILAVRTLKFRPLGITVASTVATWLVLNVPLMLANWDAWYLFYGFSDERGPGWSSVWNAWNVIAPEGMTVTAELLSTLAFGSFFICCVIIFLMGIHVPHRPRMAQLTFLIVAAFILCNKVYSPQFVVWLIPLVALALPNWRDFLIWQFFEVLHFFAIWAYLDRFATRQEHQHTFDEDLYVLAVAAHMIAVLYLMARVIYQMYRPETDPVRRSLPVYDRALLRTDGGDRLPWDDPLGGEFDGAASKLSQALPFLNYSEALTHSSPTTDGEAADSAQLRRKKRKYQA